MNEMMLSQMTNGLLQRMGLPTEGASRYANASIPEMAELCLHEAGQPVAGLDRQGLLVKALFNGLSDLLANVGNKLTVEIGGQTTSTFERLADLGKVADFRAGTSIRLKPAGLLQKTVGGEIQHLGDIVEGAESTSLDTHAAIFSIPRVSLLNDDLNILRDSAAYLARSGKRTLNRVGCSYLLSNPVLSDGTALFHADRGNLLTGAGSALGEDSLAAAMQALRLMSDEDGPYGLEPAILAVAPALERLAAKLLKDIAEAGRDRLTLIVEPLLEQATLGGSSTNWYLLPDPEVAPVFRILTLAGQGLDPILSNRANFNNDNVEFKVLMDFSVAAVSPRAIRSAGA